MIWHVVPGILRAWRRVASPILLLAIIAVVLPASLVRPLSPAALAQTISPADRDDYPIARGRFYPQAGGFSISDERGMPFFAGFLRLGGVSQLGYPVSRRFYLDGFVWQAMQGGLLQYLPETDEVVLANTFELLSRHGRDEWLYVRGVPRPIVADGAASFAEAVQTRLTWLTEPPIAERYLMPPPGWTGPWTTQDAIDRYGLPMSRPESFGLFVSQRFQRVAIQYWLQSVPGLPAAGSVTTVLGGELVRDSGILARLATLPQPPGTDFPVPVDLTLGARDPLGAVRSAGNLVYTVTTSAAGSVFPASPATAPPVSGAPGAGPGAQAASPTAGSGVSYVVIVVTARNAGSQPVAPGTEALVLRDATGQPVPVSALLTAQAAAALDASPPTAVIPPGQAATLTFAYEAHGSGPWTVDLGVPAQDGGSGMASNALPGGTPVPPIVIEEPPVGRASGGLELGDPSSPPVAPAPAELPPVTTWPEPDPVPDRPPAAPAATTVAPVPTAPAMPAPRVSEHVLPGIVAVRVFEVVRPFTGQPPAPAGQEYFYARLEVENLGSFAFPYGAGSFVARARGSSFRGQLVGQPDPLPGGTLTPGTSARGTVAFAVPLGASVQGLLFSLGNNQLEILLP